MLFNSFAFAVFLPVVFALYWKFFNKSLFYRNLFLLSVSYVFYGWWDWRFLSLLIISSFTDFFIGKKIGSLNDMQKQDMEMTSIKRKKKQWLLLSIITNIGILSFFKYCNFFIDSFDALFSSFGISLPHYTLNIILPVGISFYTFQTLSYTIDIYKGVLPPTKSWVQFFAFVGFFPQLVAGPIERAKNLLPQMAILHKPDYESFRSALLLIAWGFFKKIMIADRLAIYVDNVFGNIDAASGLPMLLGIIFFAFQLYLDFSAYSDIAIGAARLFGINLSLNFNSPYLSKSFSNFWKRWHISLSTWWQDYLYIPMGGNRKGNFRTKINLIIVFAISGLWHGASWNFVIWGLLNALFLIFFDKLLKAYKSRNFVASISKSIFIFVCWALSLVFFRAVGLGSALDCFDNLGSNNIANVVNFGLNVDELKFSFLLIAILMIKEIIWERNYKSVQTKFFKLPLIWRWLFYVILVLSIVYLGQYGGDNENAFIYFQF
ncbi:MAG: MBOAT family protein [Prevotellaceae bacterium]|jgi:D-alanyl-lipoteichoic acid acyltransferase DltB (MBOAT superfamily)|nr:MBOAT family protein [Prevotellaceae bacterium]